MKRAFRWYTPVLVVTAAALTACGGYDVQATGPEATTGGATAALATPGAGTDWDPDAATIDSPAATEDPAGVPASAMSGGEPAELDAAPIDAGDGVRVALGAPTASTTVFYRMTLPSASV